MLTFSDGKIEKTEKDLVFCEECDHFHMPNSILRGPGCWAPENTSPHPFFRKSGRFKFEPSTLNHYNNCSYFVPKKKKIVEEKKSKFKSLLIPVLILFLAGTAFVCVMYIF
jgi:hypothetical protein